MYVPKHIQTLQPYVPGKPIEETERELGITGVAKLASNENPLGPSPKALEAIRAALGKLNLYPDAACFTLKQGLADSLGVTPAELVIGNGSNEIIEHLVRTFLHPRGAAPGEDHVGLVADGSFVAYRVVLQGHGVEIASVPMRDRRFDLDAMADALTPRVRMVFIANPNNPTGTYVGEAELVRFLDRVPSDVIVVLDEAYFEYVRAPDYPDGLALRRRYPNLVVLRTFSKIHGLAGLRVGYGVMDPELVGYIDRLRTPFNVNALGQVGALAALGDTEHLARSRELNEKGLAYFTEALPRLGLEVTPSVANFVLVDFHQDGKALFQKLLREGVIVRPVGGYGFTTSLRISVGTPAENERLVEAVKKLVGA